MSVFSEKEIGAVLDEDMIWIFPERIVSWGIDSDAFSRNSRSVGRTA
jgi:hypothetical protein